MNGFICVSQLENPHCFFDAPEHGEAQSDGHGGECVLEWGAAREEGERGEAFEHVEAGSRLRVRMLEWQDLGTGIRRQAKGFTGSALNSGIGIFIDGEIGRCACSRYLALVPISKSQEVDDM